MNCLFEVDHLSVDFRLNDKVIHALQNVSLQGFKGKTLGIVGESGSGKTTLAKALMGLVDPKSGQIFFYGQKQKSAGIQMVFQDPDASLNPRMSVYNHLKEALTTHKKLGATELDSHIYTLLDMVQLSPQLAMRYPYQLSGGQKQRVSIARALSVMPELIVCDEPLSSLDVTVSREILELFKQLQKENEQSFLFITHDLRAARELAHSIAVLYLGCLLEYAPTESLFQNPMHPYTQLLLSAMPIADPEKEKKRIRIMVPGEIPSIMNPPQGCVFNTRCPFATEICRQKRPPLRTLAPGHQVACHLYP